MFRYWPAWERNSAKRRFFLQHLIFQHDHLLLSRPPCRNTTIPLFFNDCFGLTTLESFPCFCLDPPNNYQFCPPTPSMIFSLSTSCHIWHLSYRILEILFFGGWTLWRGWSWWRRATQLWGFSIIFIILELLNCVFKNPRKLWQW